MKWFDEYGWVIVVVSLVMVGAQVVRALLNFVFR